MGTNEVDYRRWIESERRRKDRTFRSDPHSPVPEDRKGELLPLSYFPVDPRYRVAARVERFAPAETVRALASGGEERTYQKFGRLGFTLEGASLALVAFLPEPDSSTQPYLFVPFRDATSGKETYGGGRYLDPDPPPGDELELDFNTAYHPYCVYDESWSCVIPPRENWLPAAIRAGERLRPE